MRPIKTPKFILPLLLRYTTIALLIAAGVWYAFWQGRHLITGPNVSIIEGPGLVESDRVVFIRGVAENATALYLNGRAIAVDQQGAFMEGVILENGYSVVSIDVTDRYGRKVHWEKSVVFVANEPAETALLPLGYNESVRQ
jgi:hypothetical protein